ncbi:MAG: hypothetical protein WD267_12740, partial [Balneolales bacterium]
PQVGLALTDIGGTMSFRDPGGVVAPLPGQIRLGAGINTETLEQVLNRPKFGVSLYAGVSKYLGRIEDNGYVPSGMNKLFTTWGSFIYQGATDGRLISPSEQISTSFGLEGSYIKTLFLRLGRVSGADLWIPAQWNAGAELDLYYISLSYAYSHFDSSNRVAGRSNRSTFQLKIRIPLDGEPRDTLVGKVLGI